MRWMALPSERCLATELKVSRETIRQALSVLEAEGLVSLAGKRRRSHLAEPVPDRARAASVDLLLGMDHRLFSADDHHLIGMLQEGAADLGYAVSTSPHSLAAVRERMGTIEPFIRSRPADARMVISGHWDDLEWLSRQPEPVLAIGGRCLGLNVSTIGFEIWHAMREAMRALTALGHRRIVMFCLSYMREAPQPGKIVEAFFDGLAEVSITLSSYNLPVWNDTAEDLQRVLDKLFQLTPPTAIFVDTTLSFATLLAFCNQRGIRIPEQLSVVLMSKPNDLSWFHPAPSMLETDPIEKLVLHAMDWLTDFRHSSGPRATTLLPGTFIRGETIGPVPASLGSSRGFR